MASPEMRDTLEEIDLASLDLLEAEDLWLATEVSIDTYFPNRLTVEGQALEEWNRIKGSGRIKNTGLPLHWAPLDESEEIHRRDRLVEIAGVFPRVGEHHLFSTLKSLREAERNLRTSMLDPVRLALRSVQEQVKMRYREDREALVAEGNSLLAWDEAPTAWVDFLHFPPDEDAEHRLAKLRGFYLKEPAEGEDKLSVGRILESEDGQLGFAPSASLHMYFPVPSVT